ncbi:hypothetical protein [Aneurinibacillus aneurinilyticus]|jgi:hypothetical protein|uniref:Uncharacterized protein n=1 Tax=Aneurinibacillus aneurinilyticus ATCC 12856 TaxID=649747 RepID=U1WGB7_ANEAE|nr:hypothetical protein [Aneurinibacillus aneurinilyticus]ERI07624.1 hypothetical protein HMPREF0083_04293 [Aneurinibacillus aneurinilyticus ATCC 12856]MCI1692725.1 hypothetical protein [Aneurinibacillus aneurinilyticus]MED0668769.1 hypothetical protein [Aneurinibacillus aneurinilyticus]MED0707223.1 hypothetical protein [Aneurinibacillus aneurinilyticus]MED0722040.1 hypothetical protein [Aneurinibacillus aneurinilyticus]
MEFAIAIQSLRDMKLTERPWKPFSYQNEIETQTQKAFFEAWETVYGKKRMPDRLYFGSEFCQYRLTSSIAVMKALEYSRRNGLAFTFVTPYVHNVKFHALTTILTELQQEAVKVKEKVEVVVNDWGVYSHIRKQFPMLCPVIGRLLNKVVRDPRIADYYDNENAPPQAINVVKGNGLVSEWFGRFLESSDTVRLEFDEAIQGFGQETESHALSFHYPFGCVASGSACMVGFMDSDKKDKFRGDPDCKQQCQRYTFELKNRQFTHMTHRIFQKGNTAFYAHNRTLIETGLRRAMQAGAVRVVYSPRLPV